MPESAHLAAVIKHTELLPQKDLCHPKGPGGRQKLQKRKMADLPTGKKIGGIRDDVRAGPGGRVI